MLQFFSNLFQIFRSVDSIGLYLSRYRRMIFSTRFVVFISLLVISTNTLTAQQYQLSLSSRLSHIFPTDELLRGQWTHDSLPINRGKIYALRFGKLHKEDIFWQQAYGKPSVGVGLEYFDVARDKELGDGLSLYAFMEAGLLNSKYFRLTFGVDFGLSYWTTHYDAEDNPNDVTLGTPINYHIGMGVKSYANVSQHIAISTALYLNHHSNGAVSKPNLGVNAASVELGLAYTFFDKKDTTIYKDRHTRTIRPYSEISLFSGVRNHVPDGTYYPFYGLHINRNWLFSGTLGMGLGAEFMHDQGYFIKRWQKENITSRNSVSVYAAFVAHVERLRVSIDFGYYIWQPQYRHPISNFYQRLSLKYQFTDRFFIGSKIRAFQMRKADLLELHVGIVI